MARTKKIIVTEEQEVQSVTLTEDEKEKFAEKKGNANKGSRKCANCGIRCSKELAFQHTDQKYYCKTCLEQKQIEAKAYKDLIEYICRLYYLDAPTIMILKQIKQYKEEYNYTYQGMQHCLYYFYVLEGNDPQKGNGGVGIIPFIYDEVKRFYDERRILGEETRRIDIQAMDNAIRTITKIKPKESEKPYTGELIDIDSLI